MVRCAVYNCNSDNQAKNFKNEVMFFRFPKNNSLKKIWKSKCRRAGNFNTGNARICSKHFINLDFLRNLKYELLGGPAPKNCRQIKPDAVPSENLPKGPSVASENCERTFRREKINRNKFVGSILSENHASSEDAEKNLGGGSLAGGGILDDNVKIKDIGIITEADVRDEEILRLKAKILLLENDLQAVGKLFTVDQLKKLRNPNGRPRWSVETISKSIVIHSAGARSYRLLLKKGYPFPAVSTLRAWLKKIKMPPGILKPVFNIIKLKEMNNLEKVCVLSFDKIKIIKVFLYDKSADETLKPSSYAQVVMLRGLFSNWKQSVFYDYDCKMTKAILDDIINYVEDCGFQVVAIVSDLGGGNRSLHNELHISTSKTWFENPANEEQIYVFADVPHLIKLIRNHFVDQGLVINGKDIGKSVIEKLLKATKKSDLNIAHKVSYETLKVKNAARQKVK